MLQKCSLLQLVTFLCLFQSHVGENVFVTSDNLSQCSDFHVQQAVENIEICKPRPTLVQLPWPDNTDIHQVEEKYIFSKNYHL